MAALRRWAAWPAAVAVNGINFWPLERSTFSFFEFNFFAELTAF